MVLHRPQVWARAEDTDEGEALVWRVHCCTDTDDIACFARAAADRAAATHLSEVAPPLDERCADPDDHHTRWWDACLLCAAQDPLPGFPVTPRRQGVSSCVEAAASVS